MSIIPTKIIILGDNMAAILAISGMSLQIFTADSKLLSLKVRLDFPKELQLCGNQSKGIK